MTTRGAPRGGLSPADVDRIRTSLTAGRRPKVVFTEAAGQIAGQVGQVVKLTDPEGSDEWLVVRFGRDELPFSPADLFVPPRGRAARREADRAPAQPATQAPKASQAAKAAPAVPAPRPAAAPPPTPTPSATAPDAPRPAKRTTRPARTARPRPPAAMTVTLAYQAGEWTVAAHQGSKTLAKPYLVRPAEALKMVAMLDVPGVHDAVEQIVTAELTEAQRRADSLRNELAEVEARLAELRDAG
ncbi:MAG: hypothetical protein GEV12_20910 [Micromonosporaceae bacterium]|nr:hypothetical protein [Micromonosporaceae bacterium]